MRIDRTTSHGMVSRLMTEGTIVTKLETAVQTAPGVVITASRVRILDDAVVVGSPRPAFPRVEPNVQLIREEGVIRALEVICGCGEKVRVKCDYS